MTRDRCIATKRDGSPCRRYQVYPDGLCIQHHRLAEPRVEQAPVGLPADALDVALADERHLGWGYATRSSLEPGKREALDAAVLAVASELELSADELFHWTNAKDGRWLVDRAEGSPASTALVRRYLNRPIVDALVAESVLADDQPERRKDA